MPRQTRFAIVAVLFGLAACSGSALAQSGSGFFGAAELVYARPTDSSRDYVIVDPNDDLAVQGQVASVELNGTATPRLTAGYRWASRWKTASDVSVTWWRFDSTRSDERASGSGVLWDLLSPPNAALAGYAGTAAASYRIKAETWDIEYGQDVLVDEKVGVHVRFGYRHLTYDTGLDVLYQGATRSVSIASSSEATLDGLRAGGDAQVRVGSHWNVSATANVAFLRGPVRSHHVAVTEPAFPGIDLGRERTSNVTTLDAGLRVGFELGPGLSLRAGIEWARWSGVTDDLTFVDDINTAAYVERTNDAVWQALTLGIGYRW